MRGFHGFLPPHNLAATALDHQVPQRLQQVGTLKWSVESEGLFLTLPQVTEQLKLQKACWGHYCLLQHRDSHRGLGYALRVCGLFICTVLMVSALGGYLPEPWSPLQLPALVSI